MKTCNACINTGFVFPKPGLRHYCGCLKGIQRLRESHDDMLAALKAAIAFIGETQEYKTGHTGAGSIVTQGNGAIAKAGGQ